MSAPSVNLSGCNGVLSVVAGWLGFHPAESVALLCLTGPDRTVKAVFRANLPQDLDPEFLDQLADMARVHADEVAIAVYTDRRNVDTAPLREVMNEWGIPVLHLILVGNGPVPMAPSLLEAMALNGRAMLRSRDALARSVAYHPEADPTQAVPVLVRLDSAATRDALIVAAVRNRSATLPVLVAAAQATPDTDPRIADLCAVLAVVAYRTGDGALAWAALDRCQAADPAHELASLLAQTIRAGMAPEVIDHIIAGL